MTSKVFTLKLKAPPPAGTAPQWFRNLPLNTWVELGNTLDSIVQGPKPYPSGYPTDDITGAGNGAGIDQENKEMLIVNTGGHSGWWGGDGYRLVLKEDNGPRWERIMNFLPTLEGDINWLTQTKGGNTALNPLSAQEWTMKQEVDDGGGKTGSAPIWLNPQGQQVNRYLWPCTFVDGVSAGLRVREWRPWDTPDVDSIMERPRAPHTCWSIHYSEGKMWYPTQCGSNNGSGRGSWVPYSCDVDFLRNYIQINNMPYTPQNGNKIPWKYYPAILNNAGPDTFPTSAIDSGTGRVWVIASNGVRFYWMGTKGAEAGTYRMYSPLPFNAYFRYTIAPNAICPDAGRRMWVTISTLGNAVVSPKSITVFDLDGLENGQLTLDNYVKSIEVNGLDTQPWSTTRDLEESRKGYGMVWHPASKAFLLFNADTSPRDTVNNTTTMFKLIPPLNSDGTWNRNGAWSVGTVTVPGNPFITANNGLNSKGIWGSSFSRFNIIHDMGNGESLLISQGNVLNPPSFMRINGPL